MEFEHDRVEHFKSQWGGPDIDLDPFPRFVVTKVDVCPHKLIDHNSAYWYETICLFDGEMGLTLPDKATSLPSLFFEALSIVRSQRSKVRKEDK